MSSFLYDDQGNKIWSRVASGAEPTRSENGVYALVKKGSDILVVKRISGPYAGLYDLPGGEQNAHEAIVQTLVKRVRDETGCDVLAHDKLSKFQVEFNCFFEEDGRKGCLAHSGTIYQCKVSCEPNEQIATLESNGAFWVNRHMLSEANSTPVVHMALKI